MADANQPGDVRETEEQRPHLGIGRVLASKYEIEALLGTGGMGSVYVARNLRTRKTWAIKVLHPEMSGRPVVLQRFLAEAQAAGVIGHPGIVEIIDQDRDGDLHFLVMPKLEGEELSTRIAREKPLPLKFVARVGADVADAVHAAHRAKIVHRDLKPPNVFLAHKDGRRDIVQLLDFGIAKLMDDDNAATGGLTQTRDIYGTPHYMSPEQLKSAKDVDARTDIYAIGVILYEALSGQRPYDADNLTELVVRIMTEEPAPLEKLRPDIPPAMTAIVKRAMARDRAARFPSAAALRDALRIHAGTPGDTSSQALADTMQADASTLSPALAVSTGKKMKSGLGIAAAVAALAVGGFVAFRPSPPAPAPHAQPTTPATNVKPPDHPAQPAPPPPMTEPVPAPGDATSKTKAPPPADDSAGKPKPRKVRKHTDDDGMPVLRPQ